MYLTKKSARLPIEVLDCSAFISLLLLLITMATLQHLGSHHQMGLGDEVLVGRDAGLAETSRKLDHVVEKIRGRCFLKHIDTPITGYERGRNTGLNYGDPTFVTAIIAQCCISSKGTALGLQLGFRWGLGLG